MRNVKFSRVIGMFHSHNSEKKVTEKKIPLFTLDCRFKKKKKEKAGECENRKKCFITK